MVSTDSTSRRSSRRRRGPMAGSHVTRIEVFADVWCPFAYVGLSGLVQRRDRLGRTDVVIVVRAWPLELVNRAPLEPVATAAHVDELRRQVVPDLFGGFDPGHFPRTTLPALALANAAYRRDGPTGEAVSLALRRALFEEGRDVSCPDVLNAVATAHHVDGVGPRDERAVHADWCEGQRRGVRVRHISSVKASTPSARRSTSPGTVRVTFTSGATRLRWRPFSTPVSVEVEPAADTSGPRQT